MDTSTNLSPDKPVWGIRAIADIINRSPRQAHYLLSEGLVDAEKVGSAWVSTPRRLLKSVLGSGESA